ncbi:MAG: hypothetical protein CEN91_438 [Candidatus Berkelbacteria bacterium Licking1014_85]|uniref:Uncharacterized protein n=1 Tax=Candidatus Berkelbacteria bacterium Licking1014_85 TaxID=2017148 RepID=A0A554LHX3_9BACT|nr:MAG: hypothetical protein CEN91_438 [Candidatus Berkelbacteria bacterium Licking1014_85]
MKYENNCAIAYLVIFYILKIYYQLVIAPEQHEVRTMTRRTIIVFSGTLFVIVGITVLTVIYISQTCKQTRRNELVVWNNCVAELEAFNNELISVKVENATAKEIDSQRNSIKEKALAHSANMMNVMKGTISLGDTDNSRILKDVISKTQEYFSAFVKLVGQNYQIKDVEVKRDSLIELMKRFSAKQPYYLTAFDKSNLVDGEAKVFALAKKVAKMQAENRKPKSLFANSSNQPQIVFVGNAGQYWSNPNYRDYYTEMREIVANYVSGRRNLSVVLSHYDSGRISENDRAAWQNELNRRRNLLTQIQSLEAQCPQGSIYRDHQQELKDMIGSAIDGMETFANNECSTTRRNFSLISQRNTIRLKRIKAFYGVR